MSDGRAFLDSLRANPNDAARWLVYADWLDDRGDPRGEYIRLVQALAANPDPARRRRLNAVRPTLPRDWLAEVEQPALIRANPTPYPFSWPGFGLGDVRPTDATYSGNDYRRLPPVPVEWIVRFEDWYDRMAANLPPGGRRPDDEDEDEDMAEMRAIAEEDRENAVPRLSAAANEFGLKLPDRFARFFMDDRHSGLSRSPTDCFFNLPERIAPAPECPEAGLIRFYSDSQGCLHWYLYLTPEGDECVVTSGARLGGDWVMRQMSERSNWRYDDEDEPGGNFAFCAPSFAEFVLRTWLESMAWYSLHLQYAGPVETRGAGTPEVRAYLDHYRSRGQESGIRSQ
jgi:uncharacterized protein (TIGR02996 family)